MMSLADQVPVGIVAVLSYAVQTLAEACLVELVVGDLLIGGVGEYRSPEPVENVVGVVSL